MKDSTARSTLTPCAPRAVCDLAALGERTITVDCDVLEADGGTRTASITGAFIALADAIHAIRDLPDPNRAGAFSLAWLSFAGWLSPWNLPR